MDSALLWYGTYLYRSADPLLPFATFGTHGTIEGETDSPGRGEGRTTLTHDTRHTVLSDGSELMGPRQRQTPHRTEQNKENSNPEALR